MSAKIILEIIIIIISIIQVLSFKIALEICDFIKFILIIIFRTNRGIRKINHNFFTIDNLPVGPGYEVDLFFPGQTKSNWEQVATVTDNRITIKQPVEQALFGKFTGITGSVSDNHVIIRNTKTGAGVDISGDFPLSGFNFYASAITVCPELFILLDLAPGKTQQWTRAYRFFTE